MPWIRLSDDYNDDEKIDALNDGAYRLWHQALAWTRRQQTDGIIPFSIMRGFKAFSKSREKQLATPVREGVAPLWELIPATGYKVHNYLRWNKSKEQTEKEKRESKARVKEFRSKQKPADVTPLHLAPCNGNVLEGNGEGITSGEEGSGEEPVQPPVMGSRSGEYPAADIGKRAADLIYRYKALYAKHRNGAKLVLVGNALEFQDACRLVELWDDARLDKLAEIVLTTDDPWISGTDRSFKIFCKKASWADDRLASWAKEHGVAV